MSKSDRRVRAAVVGAGHMGQYHTLVYAELWDVDLVGVVDIDFERARQVAGQYDTLALNMRNALPNARFLGFTGTPLIVGEEKTREVFGDYVSIYDFQQSVEDGATVPLFYENRTPELHLDNPDFNEQIYALIEEAELSDEAERRLQRELVKRIEHQDRPKRLRRHQDGEKQSRQAKQGRHQEPRRHGRIRQQRHEDRRENHPQRRDRPHVPHLGIRQPALRQQHRQKRHHRSQHRVGEKILRLGRVNRGDRRERVLIGHGGRVCG